MVPSPKSSYFLKKKIQKFNTCEKCLLHKSCWMIIVTMGEIRSVIRQMTKNFVTNKKTDILGLGSKK